MSEKASGSRKFFTIPPQTDRSLPHSPFFTSPLQTHSAQFFITGKNAAGEEALRRQDAETILWQDAADAETILWQDAADAAAILWQDAAGEEA